jgi:hypothetical protein
MRSKALKVYMAELCWDCAGAGGRIALREVCAVRLADGAPGRGSWAYAAKLIIMGEEHRPEAKADAVFAWVSIWTCIKQHHSKVYSLQFGRRRTWAMYM